MRSAGSHGIADIIGIKPNAKKCADVNHYEVEFIQIKVSEKVKEPTETIETIDTPVGFINVKFLKFPVKSKKYYGKFNKVKAKKRPFLSPVRPQTKRLGLK